MSLLLATLIPGILLILLGGGLLSGRKTIVASLKAFPRSSTATLFLFGGGAVWFLYRVWHLSPADFGNYRTMLFIAFGAFFEWLFRNATRPRLLGACLLGYGALLTITAFTY